LKKRIIFTFAIVTFLWSILILRALFIQVFPNEKLTQLKQRQFQTVVRLEGRRGAILDRNGRDLALSTPAFSLFADPKLIAKRKSVSSKLAKELGVSFENIYSKIKDPNKRFVWIQRRISKEKADRIKDWDMKGLSFVEEWKRVYPNETLLAPTIGFIGQDGQGLEGLELQFDSVLQGNNKKLNVRRDARGRPLMSEGMIFADNPDGFDMKLTVDAEIQYTLENELITAVKNFDADSAVGIVMDASTSAIRAMASVPGFDANQALYLKPEHRRNRAVADTFEPGSTLKTFVVAAALRDKKLQPNSKYFCENGSFKVADRVIREADAHHNFGWLTVTEILAYSSNIGVTKIAFELGEEKLREALLDFGFSQKLGLEIPGEARGVVQPLPWNRHLLSNISFGQGISVSALQLANAYAAVANGGTLNKPYIVESMKNSESGEVTEFQPQKIKKVLSADQAANMRLMLSSVTQDGTGVNAKVSGFIVAGKTGTAQKVNPKARGYLSNTYISSFAGFIPASDPKFVIYIAVDSPRKAYYGAQVAAPIFSRVASYAARKEGLAPTLINEMTINNKPKSSLVKREPSNSVRTLQEIAEKGLIKPIGSVPELKGMSLREVVRQLGGKDIRINVHGQGVVSQTVPAAGEPINDNGEINVFFQ
jgi:cell division protein FtsI (penicillin-binding protein 3)